MNYYLIVKYHIGTGTPLDFWKSFAKFSFSKFLNIYSNNRQIQENSFCQIVKHFTTFANFSQLVTMVIGRGGPGGNQFALIWKLF